MENFRTFYETAMRGPVVGEDPGVPGTGKTGKEIYMSALDFISRHHDVLKSDIRPGFNIDEWIQAPAGTELDSRPRFIVNHQLVATLAWVVDTVSKSGRPKGHWKLQSMHLNR